jgi:sialate O-acetylesterase
MKPELREAQMHALAVLPNMGMAVTLRCGRHTDIHPVNKQPVGERLAFWALSQTYGQPLKAYSGPLYKSFKTKGNKIIVSFSHVGSGLYAKNGGLKLFEVAGGDGVFVPALATIKGDKVELYSPAVKKPLHARYAWKNYMVPDLFNKEGLPASSFRTNAPQY